MPTATIGDQTGATYAGSIDAEIHEGTATTNYGSADLFSADKYAAGDQRNTLISFTGLSSIAGPVTVSAASMFLYMDNNSVFNDITVSARRLLRNWVEAQATWNIFSTSNNWGTAGGLSDGVDRNSTVVATALINSSTPGYIEFTGAGLLTLVQDWINGAANNYGLHLERTDASANDNSYIQWRSSEHTTATTRPYLSVTYASGGGSSIAAIQQYYQRLRASNG